MDLGKIFVRTSKGIQFNPPSQIDVTTFEPLNINGHWFMRRRPSGGKNFYIMYDPRLENQRTPVEGLREIAVYDSSGNLIQSKTTKSFDRKGGSTGTKSEGNFWKKVSS